MADHILEIAELEFFGENYKYIAKSQLPMLNATNYF